MDETLKMYNNLSHSHSIIYPYILITGIITGWGKTSNSQTAVTKKLQYVASDIMSNDDCKKVDPDYAKIVHESVLCVSGKIRVILHWFNNEKFKSSASNLERTTSLAWFSWWLNICKYSWEMVIFYNNSN